MIHVHILGGCTPTPLAHYLKALGVLRLVAEQKDASARGWWKDETFRLATVLDRDALLRFFVEEYAPSPIFNPWGGRSGYFPDASEKSAREALASIEGSTAPRLSSFRKIIAEIRELLGRTKPDADEKLRLLRDMRAKLGAPARPWLDAVAAHLGTGISHPPIFGSGGNEGSGSYTSAYMQAVRTCIVTRSHDRALPSAIWSDSPSPGTLVSLAFGQFTPAATDAGNPWTLILAFEGALSLRSSVRARTAVINSETATRFASSPFLVESNAGGYGSSSARDEIIVNKGKELPGRGEQWMPIWSRPTSYPELSQLLQEGSIAPGTRPSNAYQLARQTVELGQVRGISGFQRYGYQQRNNLATHLAVPLSRISSSDGTVSRSRLLGELENWRLRVRKAARHKHAPDRLKAAERRLADTLFSVLEQLHDASQWQAVLLALGGVEAVMTTGAGFAAGPLPPLSHGWVAAADDGSVEFRLALALARQGSPIDGGRWDGVRRHWIPLDGRDFAKSKGDGTNPRLDRRPEVVAEGRDGIADAIALVQRRLIESTVGGGRLHFALQPPAGERGATIGDLGAWLAGAVDVERTMALARPLMAVAQQGERLTDAARRRPMLAEWPDDAWLALRLAVMPWTLGDRVDSPPKADPAIVRRLAAGDAGGAFEIARRRLLATGVGCPLRLATATPDQARLWAAALAFPISRQTARAMAQRLSPHSTIGKGLQA